MKTQRRSIYAYETQLSAVKDGKVVQLKWRPDILVETFSNIMSLDLKNRVLDKRGEWFFYLANLKVDKREQDPSHKDCLYGWFESAKIGLRTDLLRRSTMSTRANPKEEDESEKRKTHFYLRLLDGFFLLDSYNNNIVTHRRIESYLENMAKSTLERLGVRHITFVNLVDEGFLEELGKFDVIRLAQVRLKIQSKEQYDTSDAIGRLQELSRPTYANYMDIVIGRLYARKRGMIARHVDSFLRTIMRNREEVIGGTIQGTRSDGGPPELKLNGIEKKYKENFKTDEFGEVLSEPVFEYMINIGNTHPLL